MARFTHICNNFTTGEVTPYLYERIDLQQYFNSARAMTNAVPLPYGGFVNRPGFYYIAEVKDSSKQVVLIPFEFNDEQAYMLEFGDQYIRFYMNKAQITSGGSPYEISTPYAEADLPYLQFAQNADVMWITHPNYKPKKLSRTGHTSWTLSDYTPTDDPFVHNTWQASHAYSKDDYVIPTSANGYYYRCVTAGTSGSSEPTWPTTIGSTVTDGGVTWRCEFDSPCNYPACVTFHEQRLWFGYTRANPQTIWATKSGDFEDMTQGSNDDDALEYTLGGNKVNLIRWLSSGKVLAMGTLGGAMIAGSNDSTTPITPTNIFIHRETDVGCDKIIPARIGSYAYYVQRGGKRLRQFSYDYMSDSWFSIDMSLLAEHLMEYSITDLDFQLYPYGILWLVRSDGTLLSFTRDVHQQVKAWAKHTTDGSFESVAVIPDASGGDDQVWVVVKRTINGATKRYIECLNPFDFGSDQADAFYVDSGLTYSGTSTTTISGLDHLEGKEVAILNGGAVEPNKTVSGGEITLENAGTKVQVGLPYTCEVETQRIAGGSVIGAPSGKIQRINKAMVSLYESLGCKVGYGTQMDTIYFRSTSDAMDSPPPLYSGYKTIYFPKGYDRDLTVKIQQEQPLPLRVRAVILFMETQDE